MSRSRSSHPYYRLRGKPSDVSQMVRESVTHDPWHYVDEDDLFPEVHRTRNEPMVRVVLVSIAVAGCLIGSVAVALLLRAMN